MNKFKHWQFATLILAMMVVPFSHAEIRRYMGPLDMNDWSRGPTCTEIDQDDPKRIGITVQCDEGDLKSFDDGSVIPNAFHNSHFDQLEKLYSTWRHENAMYADGISKISLLCKSLSRTIGGAEIKYSLGKIKNWQKKSEDSFLSRYAEAAYWRSAAWNARGNGYANTVTKEGWILYGERLKRSLEILNQMQANASEHPCWHPLKIDVMIELGAPLTEIRSVFSKAIANFPEYHDTYFSMGRAYSPLWGGSRKSFDAFVREVVDKTRDFEGEAFYARLYWTVDADNNIPFHNESSQYPKWKNLKAGYTDLMKKYPDSQWNKNRFAEIACRTNDSQLYRQLRTNIDGQFIDHMFGPGLRDTCDLKHNWQSSK